MSAPVKAATLPEVSAEVLSFAAEKSVSDYLYPVLEMTARIFAGCPLKVFVEYDPEDPDWHYLVVQAGTRGWSAERIAAGMSRWSRELVNSCPNSHTRYFVCSFA